MRRRLLASLIVCVALLTQLGASFWGAAAARDDHVFCNRQIVAVQTQDAATFPVENAPAGAPLAHDHGSCSLCQLSFSIIGAEPPHFSAQAIRFHWRVAFVERDVPEPRFLFNLNAPARAPPSTV
ncbi:hypothetical protein WOC76_02805 [Methylocystis sp. IM3]|uniref:hypothetical protein n=1 Tax=unclassified Methylocystis TaxID=2625913 RepID=UPI00311A2203